MDTWESTLEEAVVKGKNGVPGVAVGVVDRNGNFLYKNVKGYNGVDDHAKSLDFDQVFFIASCTKLLGTVAALQQVERGLVTLDEPLDKHLPELASQPIICLRHGTTGEHPSDFEMHPPKNPITLRHLITHSSGAAYDVMNPVLIAWRQSNGKVPAFSAEGVVARDYAYPRIFESGEGWYYGGGLDWAGLLVERLNNNTKLEAYLRENVFKPLGMTHTTWHITPNPHVAKKVAAMSTRQADGSLKDGSPIYFSPDPEGEGGGAGAYSTVHDYTRLLADLLREHPTVLKKETVEQMFIPQFSPNSKPLVDLYANNEGTYLPMVGGDVTNTSRNHGLGGLLVTEDVEREDYYKPKGTLTWTGLPNLLWSLNRERGVGLFFATQVVPYGDPETSRLYQQFETAVWRAYSK